MPGLPTTHGAPGRRRRMAVPQRQCWQRRAFRRDGTRPRIALGPGGENHPAITSMREHRGYLYLGGVTNNRIGRIRLAGADPEWTGPASYWGAANEPVEKSRGPMARARRGVDHHAADGRRVPAQRSSGLGFAAPRDARSPIAWPSRRGASSSPRDARCSASIEPGGAPLASFEVRSAPWPGLPDGGAAVGLADGRIVFVGGDHDGKAIEASPAMTVHHGAGACAGRRAADRQWLGVERAGRLEARPDGEKRLRLGVADRSGRRRAHATWRPIWLTPMAFSRTRIR